MCIISTITPERDINCKSACTYVSIDIGYALTQIIIHSNKTCESIRILYFTFYNINYRHCPYVSHS